MNRDLSAATTPTAEAVTGLAEAAQRALAGRVSWTPYDAASAIRAELLPLWPEVTPTVVRDMLCRAASLAVASGVTGLSETIASWAPDAMLSAELRSRNPELCPGILGPASWPRLSRSTKHQTPRPWMTWPRFWRWPTRQEPRAGRRASSHHPVRLGHSMVACSGRSRPLALDAGR
jgi:hypothetical protein